MTFLDHGAFVCPFDRLPVVWSILNLHRWGFRTSFIYLDINLVDMIFVPNSTCTIVRIAIVRLYIVALVSFLQTSRITNAGRATGMMNYLFSPLLCTREYPKEYTQVSPTCWSGCIKWTRIPYPLKYVRGCIDQVLYPYGCIFTSAHIRIPISCTCIGTARTNHGASTNLVRYAAQKVT